jgi:hypothetical protein
VRREQAAWAVSCGAAGEAQSRVLDVALVEAVRKDPDFAAHSSPFDYATWARSLADRIEREFRRSD